jgi:carbonic anhydrase
MGSDSEVTSKADSQADDPTKIGQALVLCCMDLRVVDDVVYYFNGDVEATRSAQEKVDVPTLHNKYDLVTIAGAALGATTPLRPHWGVMFWEHLELAISLHKIKEVYIVEHESCGAYKALYLPAGRREATGAEEEACHRGVAQKLEAEIKQRYAGVITHVHLLYAELPSGSAHAKVRAFAGP